MHRPASVLAREILHFVQDDRTRGGVMDGVEFPERGYPVEGAMDPVLDEVGQEHDGDELHDDFVEELLI